MLAYTFRSDYSVQTGFGAYLDDITLANCALPDMVSTPDPPLGATVCSSPTLSWTAAPGATNYDVYVDSNLVCANTVFTNCNPGILLPGMHNWYVVSKGTCGNNDHDYVCIVFKPQRTPRKIEDTEVFLKSLCSLLFSCTLWFIYSYLWVIRKKHGQLRGEN